MEYINIMKRTEAREFAFKLIYESEVQKDKELSELISDTEIGQEFSANEYIRSVLFGVREKRDELDALITENSRGWKLKRISMTSGAILRLAIYEMLYTEIPFIVAINEAVELAKKYDDEKAPGFINGILNSVAEKAGLKTAGKGKGAKPKTAEPEAEKAEAEESANGENE